MPIILEATSAHDTALKRKCLRELAAILHYSRIKARSLSCESTKQAVPSEAQTHSADTKVLKKRYIQLFNSLNYLCNSNKSLVGILRNGTHSNCEVLKRPMLKKTLQAEPHENHNKPLASMYIQRK